MSTDNGKNMFDKLYARSVLINDEILKSCGITSGVDFSKNKATVPMPKKYIINHGATVLIWNDGEKTIVKRCEDDEFNKRLGFLTAFFQHYCGMSKNKANKFLAELEVEDEEKEQIEETKGTKNKFKVGDKVKVRNDLIEYEKYGSNSFVDSMKKFKGETVTIAEINVGHFCNEYRIFEDNKRWNWTDEMFETIEAKHMKGEK